MPNDHPGPGHYNEDYNAGKPKAPSFKQSRSKRDYLNSSNADNPGPGNYDHQMSPGGPSFQMGGKPAADRYNDHPGPGHYEFPDQHPGKNAAPSFSVSKNPR